MLVSWVCCKWFRWTVVVVKMLSRVWLFATPWTAACQVPLSMEFRRQKYWSGLPFPPRRDLPNSGFKPMSPALTGTFITTELPGKPIICLWWCQTLCFPSRRLGEQSALEKVLGRSTVPSHRWGDRHLWESSAMFSSPRLPFFQRLHKVGPSSDLCLGPHPQDQHKTPNPPPDAPPSVRGYK